MAEPVPVSGLEVEDLGRGSAVVQAAPVARAKVLAAPAGLGAQVAGEVRPVVAEAEAAEGLMRASGTLVRVVVAVVAATVRAVAPAAVVVPAVELDLGPEGLAVARAEGEPALVEVAPKVVPAVAPA